MTLVRPLHRVMLVTGWYLYNTCLLFHVAPHPRSVIAHAAHGQHWAPPNRGFRPPSHPTLPWHPELHHRGCFNRRTLIYRVNHYEMEEISDYHRRWFDLMEPHSKLLIFSLSQLFSFKWQKQIKIWAFVQPALRTSLPGARLADHVQIHLTSSLLLLRLGRTASLPFGFSRDSVTWKLKEDTFIALSWPVLSLSYLEVGGFGSLEWRLAVHFLMAADSHLAGADATALTSSRWSPGKPCGA